MPYTVHIERKAQKKLIKISEPHYSKLKTAILNLGNNPRPQGYIKLKNRDAFRIRVSDYRVIYEISDKQIRVNIINLGHRKNIY